VDLEKVHAVHGTDVNTGLERTVFGFDKGVSTDSLKVRISIKEASEIIRKHLDAKEQKEK
jgi:hypothetical protein